MALWLTRLLRASRLLLQVTICCTYVSLASGPGSDVSSANSAADINSLSTGSSNAKAPATGTALQRHDSATAAEPFLRRNPAALQRFDSATQADEGRSSRAKSMSAAAASGSSGAGAGVFGSSGGSRQDSTTAATAASRGGLLSSSGGSGIFGRRSSAAVAVEQQPNQRQPKPTQM
jgi:hypothetical protein